MPIHQNKILNFQNSDIMTVNPLELPQEQLSENQESILEKNIVWIFGANRSGTSWLGRLLGASECNLMDEPLLGQHLGISFRTKIKINLFKDVSEKLPISESSKKSIGQSDSMVRQIDIQKNRKNYFFSTEFSEVWQYYLRKLFLNRIYSQFEDINKKIIIKEPNGSIGADIITECFPRSNFIILLRDPRDILDSRVDALSEAGWSTKEGWNVITSKNKIMFIEREALRWIQLIKILIKIHNTHKNKNCLLVKYEDLRKDTLVELPKIFDFLKLNVNKDKLHGIVEKLSFEKIPIKEKGKGKRKRIAQPGKWKENFTEKEKEIMHKIMASTIKDIGYE